MFNEKHSMKLTLISTQRLLLAHRFTHRLNKDYYIIQEKLTINLNVITTIALRCFGRPKIQLLATIIIRLLTKIATSIGVHTTIAKADRKISKKRSTMQGIRVAHKLANLLLTNSPSILNIWYNDVFTVRDF